MDKDKMQRFALMLIQNTLQIETERANFKYSAAKLVEKARDNMIGTGGKSRAIKAKTTNIVRTLLEHHRNEDGMLEDKATEKAINDLTSYMMR